MAPPQPQHLLRNTSLPPWPLLQMRPMYGWVMAYEWTTLLFVVFYSQFLRACYVWGQRSVWRGEGFKDDT